MTSPIPLPVRLASAPTRNPPLSSSSPIPDDNVALLDPALAGQSEVREYVEPGAEVKPHVAALPVDWHSPAERRLRTINLIAVTVPFLGLIAAIALSWGWGFGWTQLAVFLSMFLLTGYGITVGYHRLFTHKAFVAPAFVRWTLAVLGSMAVQGPIITWAGTHRKHHQHSDDHDDPHSPHVHSRGSWGQGIRGTLRGMWHAHIGWMIDGRQRGLGKYTRDLAADPVLAAVNRQFPMWVLIGLAIPALVAGLITWSVSGALLGFLWGGLVRIFFVHHVTWSVNSVCHLWGSRPYRTGDESRNNPIVGVLALGEGWHNNHHAFPTSARHGLRWWQVDTSYLIIRALGLFGLAREIRTPTKERMLEKRRNHAA